MLTLYQKYRPRNFGEVVNQNHVKITLQNEIESGQIAHAYLFSGPHGTGKTTMARVFSKSLNCERRSAGQSEPCGECQICQQISMGTSLDIVEIDAASHTGVDNVRENIISNARIAIGGNRYKVFIIDEVHMLSTSAFNALLKILEEPPQKVVFILATTEVHQLPTTIISRCQRFDFKRISAEDIVKKLDYIVNNEGIKVQAEVLQTIARQSGGHMRDAESLLGQVLSIGGKNITNEHADLIIPRSNMSAVADLIDFLYKKDSAKAVYLINQLVDEGIDLRQFTADVIETLRKLMLAKVSPILAEKFTRTASHSTEEKLTPVMQQMSVSAFASMITVFTAAHNELKMSFIAQLPLEIAVVNITCNDANKTSSPMNTVLTAPKTVTTPDNAALNLSNTAINIDKIIDKWSEVLVKIKKYNHSLSFILHVCELRDKNGVLCLAFKYKFHQDRVEQPKIKEIMQKVFQEVYGTSFNFFTVLDETLEIANQVPVPEKSTSIVDDGNNASVVSQTLPAEQSESSAQNDVIVDQPEIEKKQPNQPDNTDVDAILKMFGGKIVG